MRKLLATTVAGIALALAPVATAHADDPHQAPVLEVKAQFHGTCTNWYVAYWGVQQDTKNNQEPPSAQVEIDIQYKPVLSRTMVPGSYGELHRHFRHNNRPKLVQVYADGVLVRSRLFTCGYIRASAN